MPIQQAHLSNSALQAMAFPSTIVSIAIWIVALLVNLPNWMLQPEGLSRPVVWSILVASGVGFGLIFYRHFDRTVDER